MDRLRSASYFTKIDLRGAYNLVRIRQGDEWKTAFRSRYGHFEYTVMPYGLCNAPATFQRFVNEILRDILDIFVVVYLDDILIYSDTSEQHKNHVCTVLARLREHCLYAKLEKCLFDSQEVEFLGYILSPGKLQMDQGKVEAILSWPVPTTRKGVQSFLGFCNFYRRFIRNFSKIAQPITVLTKKEGRFQWTEGAQKAFDSLKCLFTTAPVLVLPKPNKPYYLEVDASDTASGAVLSQREGLKDDLHPVAFFSRSFSSAEKNYDVADRELLAIKLALEEWRHLLEGAAYPVTIYTDHRNLEYLQKARRLRPRQARWALFFSRFDLIITYRPGSKNGKADALSRMPVTSSETTNEPDNILPSNFFLATGTSFWEELQQQTEKIPVHTILPQMKRQQGYLLYNNCIVVPPEMVPKVLAICHDSPLAGHGGLLKTKHLIQRTFWWRKMEQDIKAYVAACPTCIRSKDSRIRPQGLLQPLSVPSRAWEDISMDFIVELPVSQGHNTIVVIVDRLTKMSHFLAAKGLPTAKQTAQLFVKEMFRLHGLPTSIVSDRGSQFTSKFWRAFCDELSIQRNLTTAFHPQSNGQTERTNQTLEQYLRCYIAHLQDDWLHFLPLAEFAYNNQIHRSINMSPFFANYGFHPTMLPSSPVPCSVPEVETHIKNITDTYALLRKTLSSAQVRYKRYYDRLHNPEHQYKVGDKVWLSTRHLRLQCPSKKLGPRFVGPFPIDKVVSPVAMKLRLPGSYKIHPVFHISLLKPDVPDVFPSRTSVSQPGPVIVDGEEEYEVERILDSRHRRNRLEYLVSWKGYGPEENSWVPASDVHAPSKVRAFHRAHPQKPNTIRPRSGRSRGGHCENLPLGVLHSFDMFPQRSMCIGCQHQIPSQQPLPVSPLPLHTTATAPPCSPLAADTCMHTSLRETAPVCTTLTAQPKEDQQSGGYASREGVTSAPGSIKLIQTKQSVLGYCSIS